MQPGSKSDNEFKRRWDKVSNIWLKYPDLIAFHDYFKNQWIYSQFNKWAVFHSPPGYSSINNAIESYNRTIKSFFTNNLKLNLIPAFKIFKELVFVKSSKEFVYKNEVSVTKTQENKSKILEQKKNFKNL